MVSFSFGGLTSAMNEWIEYNSSGAVATVSVSKAITFPLLGFFPSEDFAIRGSLKNQSARTLSLPGNYLNVGA